MVKKIEITNVKYPFSTSWDKEKNYVIFDIKNISTAFINSIRRTIISDVNTIGFRSEPYNKCSIEITQNDTPLHNQLLSHRIAMIPLNIGNVSNFKVDDYEFIIDVENNTNFTKTITTKDFQVKQISTNKMLSEKEANKLFSNTDDHSIIIKLKPKHYKYNNISNQNFINTIKGGFGDGLSDNVRLYLKAKTVISNGAENGHFSPICCCAHTNKVDMNKAKIMEKQYIETEKQKCIDNGLKPFSDEDYKKRFETTYLKRNFHTNENDEPYWFEFKLESVGSIPPLIIFNRGLNKLKDRINRLRENLMTGNEEVIEIMPSKRLLDGYLLIINDEDETLGNLIQKELEQMFCRYGDKDRILNYVGYTRIHKLERKISLELQPIDRMEWNEVLDKILIICCNDIIKKLNYMMKLIEDLPQLVNEMKRI